MADFALARDNLFQLNCLLWASLPQAPDAPVTPVLKNAGYVLWGIEQPLNSSVAELARLRKATLQIQQNPVVDVVLHHTAKDVYILTECKPSSFGVGSEWSPQARGLIVAGSNISSRLGLSGKHLSEVCYLVPIDDTESIDITLIELCNQVTSQGFTPCPTGPLGLSIRDDGVYLGVPSQPKGTAQMPLKFVPEERVLRVNAGQDPSPLYIVPWIPDVQDDANLEAFKEKLRVSILSWLGRALVGTQITLSFEELLDEVSRGVFQKWRDKASLIGRVLPMVAKVVDSMLHDDARVSIAKHDVRVTLSLEVDREQLMEKVRTAGLPQKLPEGVQLHMEEQV
jgi:hypothetical protein